MGGPELVSTNSRIAVETDLSGLTEFSLLPDADFLDLRLRHAARMNAVQGRVQPFGNSDPVGELVAFRARRAIRLAELGSIRFLGRRQDAWVSAWKGLCALRLSRERIQPGHRPAG